MTTIWPRWSRLIKQFLGNLAYGRITLPALSLSSMNIIGQKNYIKNIHLKINNEHTMSHISQFPKERIKEKYAENGAMLDFVHEHKMSCLKCLNFSKENNMIKLAEKHEKCWSNTFASATCLNSLLEKIIINQHCFKYYRSLNIPNAGLFAINSLYWSLKYW